MSIANQIRRIKNAKAAIKEAIQNKGVTVSDEAKLDEYPRLIDSIVASESNNYWPDFFEVRAKGRYGLQQLFYGMDIKESDTRYKELIENLDMSKATWFNEMFMYFCNPDHNSIARDGSLKELDLTKWNVSKVMTFTNMFEDCLLDYLDISGWDFSSASTNLQILYGTQIKEVNMSNCNVSNVTSHYRLCYIASGLITLNITGWDTSKVTNMNAMFSGCTKLITITGELDVSGLTNGFYPSATNNPFNNCPSLETVYLKNIYKDIAVTNVSKFSIDLGATKVKDECLVYIIDQLPNLADKGITNNTAIKLTLPTTNTLTDEQKQVALDKGWIVVN